METVKRKAAHNCEVLPKRWTVERTFFWLGRYGRLSRDYGTLTECSEAMVRIAMMNLMVHRLGRG